MQGTSFIQATEYYYLLYSTRMNKSCLACTHEKCIYVLDFVIEKQCSYLFSMLNV